MRGLAGWEGRGGWGYAGVGRRGGLVDLSGFKTEILRFRRNPTFQEKSCVSGEILCFRRNPMFQEKSNVSGEILCFKRNPVFQEDKEGKGSKGRQG